MRLSIPKAAEKLGISSASLRNWVKDNRIPYYKIGQKLLFVDEEDIDDFINFSRISSADSNETRGQ